VISRRIFVRNALIVSAGTWAAAYGLIGLGGKIRIWLFPRRLPETVLAWLAEQADGAAAGEAIELRSPHRRQLVATVEDLLTRTAMAGRPLEEALLARIDEDFATGRTLRADGWIVSETEAGVFLIQHDIQKGLVRAS
jgi:hypothetical protein